MIIVYVRCARKAATVPKLGNCVSDFSIQSIWSFIKLAMESYEDLLQNRRQDGPKLWKIDLWGCLGGLWGPSWRPGGAGATTRVEKLKKYRILGTPRGEKWTPDRYKIRLNNFFFHNDFETTFYRSWDDFYSKNLSKLRGLGVVFFDLAANMREVWFWTTLNRFCYIFKVYGDKFSILKSIF